MSSYTLHPPNANLPASRTDPEVVPMSPPNGYHPGSNGPRLGILSPPAGPNLGALLDQLTAVSKDDLVEEITALESRLSLLRGIMAALSYGRPSEGRLYGPPDDRRPAAEDAGPKKAPPPAGPGASGRRSSGEDLDSDPVDAYGRPLPKTVQERHDRVLMLLAMNGPQRSKELAELLGIPDNQLNRFINRELVHKRGFYSHWRVTERGKARLAFLGITFGE